MKLYYSLLLTCLIFSVAAANAQMPAPAETVVKNATQLAQKSNRKVLLIFHASWCGWCHKMDSSLNDPGCKKYFDKNFVIEHLTVMESKGKENLQNPGALELMNKYDGKDQGLPYWVILDKDGKTLFDSQTRKMQPDGTVKGSNMGCPASADEVKVFINILKQTTKLDDTELTAISKRFRLNEN